MSGVEQEHEEEKEKGKEDGRDQEGDEEARKKTKNKKEENKKEKKEENRRSRTGFFNQRPADQIWPAPNNCSAKMLKKYITFSLKSIFLY